MMPMIYAASPAAISPITLSHYSPLIIAFDCRWLMPPYCQRFDTPPAFILIFSSFHHLFRHYAAIADAAPLFDARVTPIFSSAFEPCRRYC
jgi:hypothetical protein